MPLLRPIHGACKVASVVLVPATGGIDTAGTAGREVSAVGAAAVIATPAVSSEKGDHEGVLQAAQEDLTLSYFHCSVSHRAFHLYSCFVQLEEAQVGSVVAVVELWLLWLEE